MMSAFAAIFSLLLFTLIAIVLPESPIWLDLQGRKGDAEMSLKRLGLCQSILNGSKPDLPAMPNQPQKFSWTSWIMSIQKLKRKDVYKPMLLLTTAIVILTISGAHAVLNYQVDIVGSDPTASQTDTEQQYSAAFQSSVVSGALVLVAHCFTSLILPTIGVRKMMISSCICLAASFILLGYTIEKETDLFIWRIIAVWMITFIYHFGIQTTSLSVLGDSFPADAKGFAGVPILGLVVSGSVLVKVHPFLVVGLGANVYYIYAGTSFLGAVYIMEFFHETVGKSLQEINEGYRR